MPTKDFLDGAKPVPQQDFLANAQPVSPPPPPPPPPSMGQRVLGAAKDVGTGLLKGAGSTANNIGHLFYPDALAKHLTGAPSAEQQESYFKPANTTQAISKGIEQAGEFMLPGGAEEKGAAKLAELIPKAGKFLPRLLTSATSAGLVNKAQGGDFSTGAAAGGIGAGVGAGLKAAAPSIAESALNIRKLDRAYGKTPGKSLLAETKGLTPGAVADSAQSVLDKLNPQLDRQVDRFSYAPISSLQPARQVVGQAASKAAKQGERTTFNQLMPQATHLNEDIAGAPIPQNITPRELLDLKRGFGNEFIHHWNPETMAGVKGTAARTYHELGNELNASVPGAKPLNTRISNLIPVAKRAESAELNAPTSQRVFHRIGAHTGALAGGLFGGYQGYQHGGVPGAVGGAVFGTIAPEMLASPTGELTIARTLNSPLPRLLTRGTAGGLLQLNRPSEKEKNSEGGGSQ